MRDTVLSISEAVKNCAEVLAISIGALWALRRFVLRRESKPAVDIELGVRIIPQTDERFLVYFDVTLTNRSTRRVLARRRKRGEPAFTDRSEALEHSCSLLIRRVPATVPVGSLVRWFADADAKSPLSTDIVTNLLDEYEYENEGKRDFWMEPSESSHLCVGVILDRGGYLAMVTFVGPDRKDREFWRRLFIVEVPEREVLQPTPVPLPSNSMPRN